MSDPVHIGRMPPRPRLTHFLCIPLVTPESRPQLHLSLQNFRDDIAQNTEIPERAVRPLGSLHLTLGVMSLTNQETVDTALSLLKSLDLSQLLLQAQNEVQLTTPPEATDTPLSVTLSGLRSMHRSSKTSILYSSPVDPTSRLPTFCTRLKEAFSSRDLLVPDDRPLLLHATILNTIYAPGVRSKSGNGGHGKKRARLTIDARELLAKYDGFEWMKDVKVTKVAICRMGAKKVVGSDGKETGDEEYIVEGEVNMP